MPDSPAASYEISSDFSRIDWPRVQSWLSTSYWSPGISEERIKLGARNSALVLGAYKEGVQAAYLRVISDKSRFAYLCDVWVDANHRGKGLARRMVQHALDHPDFTTVKWLLATADAHGVYKELGFVPIPNPEVWMSRGVFCSGE